jgi:pyocin large subunit-like protein
MRKDRCPIGGRIDSFVSNPDAGTLTGERRMGTERLLDMLADLLAEDDSANVIRIMKKNGVLDTVRSEIRPEKKNHILLYVDIDLKETDLIITEFPDAQIYRAKELCHQVPVCFKESASSNNR